MAVTVMPRETDTDKRLDDLNARVDSIDRRMETGFAEVREEFRAVRAENGGLRAEMQDGFKEAQAESVSIRQDMATQSAAQNRLMVQLVGGMFATFVIGIIGIIATIITTA